MSEPLLDTSPAPVPQPALSERERTDLQRMLAFPLELPPEFVSYFEERMRLLLTSSNVLGLMQRVAVVGDYKDIAKDLSAQTAYYVWEDSQGSWLYCNGASIVGKGHVELEAFLGGTTLPDCRSRSPVYSGTHVDCDLFDTFGAATESSRRGPLHGHPTTSLTVTGAPSITDPGHYHDFTGVTSALAGAAGSVVYTINSQPTQNTNSKVTGITAGLGTLDVGGTIGTDTNDGGAAIVVGSRLIKC